MQKTLSHSNPWQRIEAVISHYGFQSISAFARHIGLSRAENLYQIKRGNNGISGSLADAICATFPEISKSWLLAGENTMISNGVRRENEVIGIPFYLRIPNDPAAGKPDKILYCSPEIVNDAELATVYRDMALLPTYKSGAILFLKKWDLKQEPVYGNVYFVRTETFERFRIIRRESDRDRLKLATNRPKKYDDMIILKDSIISLYQVCGANII